MFYLALVHMVIRCARVWTWRRRGALHLGVFALVWFRGFWYAFGDHDALALCSWRIFHWWWSCYLGGALLHVGDLVHDALVLEGSCLWSATHGDDSWLMWWRLEVTLEDDDAVLPWMVTWWRICFDDLGFWLMEDWLGWCFAGLDDVLVDGGSCTFLLYILPVSWSLPPLRVGSLKYLLVGSKRTLAGPSEELELLFQLELKDLWRLKSSTLTLLYQWFLSMNNDWVFHLYLVHIVYLVYLLLCIKDSWMWHILSKN